MCPALFEAASQPYWEAIEITYNPDTDEWEQTGKSSGGPEPVPELCYDGDQPVPCGPGLSYNEYCSMNPTDPNCSHYTG